LGEAMSQSSETFHDNAPAESIRDEQEILLRRAKPLMQILRHHVVIDYPDPKSNIASIGSRVTVQYDNSNERFDIDIVGYRPSSAEYFNDTEIISYESPLAAAILGNQPGTKVYIGDPPVSLDIIEVNQTAVQT